MLPITIGSVLFGLALLIVVLLFLARPFFRPQLEQTVTLSERQQLMTRKEALLDAIRALEFDHDTGKLPDAEFEQERQLLMSEAAVTLKAIDELPEASSDDNVYAQIEAAVAARRKGQKARGPQPVTFCAQCGNRLDGDDNFCPRCGEPVYAAQPST